MLVLRVNLAGGTMSRAQEADKAAANDGEKINTLRVIILDGDKRVEHNSLWTLDSPDIQKTGMRFKVKANDTKTIVLVANEAGTVIDVPGPGGIGSTNHKGTDIGRVGYTSPVYAAKAGTVIIAQRSSSYGNYVVISHGVGNTTLYAHMSSIKVSVGTYVKQGQTIGITGSTGHSTGPHLHFEVVENNVRINPLSHGAAPKKGYLTGYTLSGTSVGK